MKSRIKRHKRIRQKITGTAEKPRISVYRSSKGLQAQLIIDSENKTLIGIRSSDLKDLKGTKSENAKVMGKEFGTKILGLEKGKYDKIVFDRGGYKYHGRIKAFAEGLRESGLKF